MNRSKNLKKFSEGAKLLFSTLEVWEGDEGWEILSQRGMEVVSLQHKWPSPYEKLLVSRQKNLKKTHHSGRGLAVEAQGLALHCILRFVQPFI